MVVLSRLWRLLMNRAVQLTLSLAAALVVQLVVGRAWAVGPLCDPQGSTEVADSPVLAVPDVRWEQQDVIWSWLACRAVFARLEPRTPNCGEHLTTDGSETASDLGLMPKAPALAEADSTRARLAAWATTKDASGFPPGVYRPPRYY